MISSEEHLPGAAFITFPLMRDALLIELKERFSLKEGGAEVFGDDGTPQGCLVYVPDFDTAGALPYWSKCAMLDVRRIVFDSVSDAKNHLRSIQRSWAPYSFTCYRRTALIQDALPHINIAERVFPFTLPESPIGAYCLLDPHTLFFSERTSSPLPCGTLRLREDHVSPPSRAYLKLEEALVMADYYFGCGLPGEGSRCFDAGASPGGWTYVLLMLGARVLAVDRSPLAPRLMRDGRVEFMTHDAFTLTARDIGRFDWVFSDVACYPERLLGWIQKTLSEGMTRNMICTIKLHGKCDFSLISHFEEIPQSRVLHLNYNRHELTFIHCG